jgi:hypothetical protein
VKRIGIVLLLALAACGAPAPSEDTGPLAAIDRGHETQLQAALRSAATAEETFRAETGTYSTSLSELNGVGYTPSDGVAVMIVRADANGYCLQATHPDLDEPYHLDSSQNSPASGPC